MVYPQYSPSYLVRVQIEELQKRIVSDYFETVDAMYEEAEEANKRALRDAKAAKGGILPSHIMWLTILALTAMQEMAGWSAPLGISGSAHPYQGDCFKEGEQHFSEVAKLLETRTAQSWHGLGAGAYTSENNTLIDQAKKMASLDLEMEKLVKDQAGHCWNTQLGIGIQQDIAILVLLYCLFTQETNVASFAAAWDLAVKTSISTVEAAQKLLIYCLGTSIATAIAVGKLGYANVMNAPKSGGSAASDGAQVFGSVSASSAISGTTPTVASSPGSATGLGPRRTPLDASTGNGKRFGVDSPQVAAAPDQGAPLTPASGAPSLTQLRQRVVQLRRPSWQAANLSASVASPSDRINPQGRQGAPEEAVRAGGSEDTGAGPTAAGAQRAPIDIAAAGPEQAPAPKPAPAP
jgi:hypothetical protein